MDPKRRIIPKKTRTFQGRLLILFLLSIIIPILLLATSLAYFFQNKLISERLEYSSSTLFSVSNNLSSYASDLSRVALTPHIYDDIMNFYACVQNGTYTQDDDSYITQKLRQNYITTLQRILITSREDIVSIAFMPADPDQTLLLVTSNQNELNEINDYNYKTEAWFQNALDANGSIIYTTAEGVPYQDKPGTVFSAVHKVRDVYGKKDIGIIRIDASDKLIRTIFSQLKIGDSSAFLLVDEEGSIIYHTGSIDAKTAEKILPDTTFVSSPQDSWDIYQQPIDKLPWRLVYMSSRKDARREIAIIWILAALLSLSSILIAFLLFRSNSRKMTATLHKILETMSNVAKGVLDRHIEEEHPANNEFAMIATHLNAMMDQLKLHIQNEYDLKIRQQRAEYRALQSQINPHFLYNTLNTFVSLNRLNMKKQLEDSIISLTKIFRYTCNEKEYTTVTEEFDFCRQYIELLKVRHEEKIDYSVELEADAADIVIPRLLVQPLVENAVKHGMDPSGEPIFIRIAAFMNDRTLSLSVKNNGIPIGVIDLDNEHCIGLKNIKERAALFSPGSVFRYFIDEDRYSSFVITIPQDPAAKGGLLL